MVIEKSHTAQQLIEQLSVKAAKVSYIKNDTLSKALMYLEREGLPTNKHEDYKYCNLDAVIKKEFKNCTQEFNSLSSIEKYKVPGISTLVLLNGSYEESLSDIIHQPGISIRSLSKMDEAEKKNLASLADVEKDAFVALNTSFSADGVYVQIAQNTRAERPIRILSICSTDKEVFLNSRNFVVLDQNASATIIEESVFLGSGKLFHNSLSEKLISENAHLITYQIQHEGEKTYSVATSQIELQKNSSYKNTTITLSGQVVRNNHNVVLKGENSSAHLFGLFSSKSNQLVDNHTLMDHQVPNCESNELYKGIVNDKSTGVFNGKIYVKKDAQKTNAYQSSKNILLSDDATINTKPQLEIYANDVKCSHGTSTGKIDENALFYLKARGIGEQSAKKILLNSFAQEIIHTIELEALRDKISELYENGL